MLLLHRKACLYADALLYVRLSLAFLNPRCAFCEHSEANFMDRPRVAFVSSFKGSWLDLRAMALEDIVFVLCEGAEGAAVPVCGWVVALPGADAVIATSDQSASSLPQTITETAGGQGLFLASAPRFFDRTSSS